MKKIVALFIIGFVYLYGAKLPEYEIRPNVSGVNFEKGSGIEDGYTYGVDFAKKINSDFMANISYKRKTFDYMSNLGSSFINFYALNAEYYYFEKDNLQSYLTAGLSYVNPQDKFNTGVDNMFGVNYGIGGKYLINEDAGLFAEIKHLTTFESDENQLVYSFGVLIPFGYEKEKEPAAPLISEPEPVKEVVEEFRFEDDDRDGVVNELDKCPNTDLRYEVDEQGCKIFYTLLVNFEFDSAVLTEDSYDVIEQFAVFMDEPKKLKAEIQGHTDSRGSDEYNQALSERRAQSVYNALIKQGIPKERLQYVGFGEKKLLIEEDGTEDTYSKNRRVEAIILK
jgi:OOP family OmpA-OmpF porin